MTSRAAASRTEASPWEKLREPFPPALIGKLPKGGVMLDFVGHAAVTDRLLQVDPEWTWAPLAVDEYGLPMYDRHNNLWIKLTIAGVTRLGVGDGKNAKECIGDAIRNAAMRFGVALDLWAKEDLHAFEASSPDATAAAETRKGSAAAKSPPGAADQKNGEHDPPTAEDLAALFKLVEERGGDVAKTMSASDTAQERGKLGNWYSAAVIHWTQQPVMSDFGKKAVDAQVAGEKARAEREQQAQADRDGAKAA